jgi:hypothetical protein
LTYNCNEQAINGSFAFVKAIERWFSCANGSFYLVAFTTFLNISLFAIFGGFAKLAILAKTMSSFRTEDPSDAKQLQNTISLNENTLSISFVSRSILAMFLTLPYTQSTSRTFLWPLTFPTMNPVSFEYWS